MAEVWVLVEVDAGELDAFAVIGAVEGFGGAVGGGGGGDTGHIPDGADDVGQGVLQGLRLGEVAFGGTELEGEMGYLGAVI